MDRLKETQWKPNNYSIGQYQFSNVHECTTDSDDPTSDSEFVQTLSNDNDTL